MDNLTTFEVDNSKLYADFDNRKYYIQFINTENIIIKSEISEEIFYTYLKSKKRYKSNENEEYRHWEHISLTDNELYNRTFLKEQKVDEIVERRELYFELYESIKLLSDSQREKLLKYYFEGKNMVEIAEECNISKQAVSKSLKDSYDFLRKILKNFEN